MRIVVFFAAVIGMAMIHAQGQQMAPANDSFAQAITVPSWPGVVTVAGTLTGATREPGEPYNSNGVASVWYKWTPAVSGYFRLLQQGTVSAWIFSGGGSVTNLTLLGGDGETPWLERGAAYYVGVFGRMTVEHYPFELKVDTVFTRPENDDITNAIELTENGSGKVFVRGTGMGATYEAREMFNTNGLPSVWYKWVPSRSGRVRFLSERPLPGIWFFFAQSEAQQTEDPFAGMGNTAREGQSPFLAIGRTYYIAVFAVWEDVGEFDFAMELAQAPEQPRPSNDDFANAIELQEVDGHVILSGTHLGATFERNEPYYGNSFGAVWYKWTPSGRLIGYTPYIGFNGPRLFSGTALGNLKLVQDWQFVIPGQTYYISVNGAGEVPMPFQFAIQVETPSNSRVRPPNDDFHRAFELREASGVFFIWLEGATPEPEEPISEVGCERTVWHKFTAPVDGIFHIGPESTAFNVRLVELFTGDSLAALVPVRSEDTERGQRFSLTGGQTYYVRARECLSYNFQLKYAFLPTEITGGVTVAKRLSQSITMDPLRDVYFGSPPIWLRATASSGLSVTFSVVAGSATISGSLLTVSGGGFVTVAASQGGNEIYEPATEVLQTFRVRPVPQSLSFEPVDSSVSPVRLRASSSSGLPVSFEVISGAATISDGTITESSEGPLTVKAVQPGNDNYEPARPVIQTFVAKRVGQAISFSPIGLIDLNAGDIPPGGELRVNTVAKSIAVSAAASSGLPVSFVVRSGPAQVAGKALTITGPGEVLLEAVQSGDVVFAPATSQQTIRVFSSGDAPRVFVSKSGAQMALQWPRTFSEFKVETASAIEGPWFELEATLETNLTMFSYSTNMIGGSGFFRLKRR